MTGQGSSTRLHLGMVTVTGCFVAIYLAVVNRNANHLFSVGTFLTAAYGAAYGTNRYFNNKDLQAQPSTDSRKT